MPIFYFELTFFVKNIVFKLLWIEIFDQQQRKIKLIKLTNNLKKKDVSESERLTIEAKKQFIKCGVYKTDGKNFFIYYDMYRNDLLTISFYSLRFLKKNKEY